MKNQMNLSQAVNKLSEGKEIKILESFVVTLTGKKNTPRKFKSNKSYWVSELKPHGVVVDYYTYNGRNRSGLTSELIRYDKNKELQIKLIS